MKDQKVSTVDMYNRVRNRVRESTTPGFEVPRLNLVETIFCEMLGELQQEIKELKLKMFLDRKTDDPE